LQEEEDAHDIQRYEQTRGVVISEEEHVDLNEIPDDSSGDEGPGTPCFITGMNGDDTPGSNG
jgi:hypothetical protein